MHRSMCLCACACVCDSDSDPDCNFECVILRVGMGGCEAGVGWLGSTLVS